MKFIIQVGKKDAHKAKTSLAELMSMYREDIVFSGELKVSPSKNKNTAHELRQSIQNVPSDLRSEEGIQ